MLEMTVAVSVTMLVATGSLMLLGYHTSFMTIVSDFRFLREEAPQINSLVTQLVSKAVSYRIHSSPVDAFAGTNAVNAGGRAVRLVFRNPSGQLDQSVIAFETIDRVGKIDIVGGRPLIIDSEGRRHDMTEPLGLEEVFSHREDDDVTSSLPAGTRIGHVHLYVGDLEAAQAFYEEMGFTRHMDAAGIGFADLSLGGTFPHRIAVNVWQGIGAPQAPAGTAGMKHFELFESEPSGETRELEDPSGNRLLICPRP